MLHYKKNVTVNIFATRKKFHTPESDWYCEIQSEVRLYTLTNSASTTIARSFCSSIKNEIVIGHLYLNSVF